MRAVLATINSFFERFEIQWEFFMMSLAVVFVIIGFAPQTPLLIFTDMGITIFFVIEFAVRFIASPSKKGYLKGHWIDLVALLPAIRFFRVFRAFRILRLLRLLALFRFFASAERVKGHIKGIALQNGLQWVLLAVIMVMLICAIGLFLVEHGQNPNINSFDDALWWSIVTVTTVGYGDIYAVTVAGRIFSVLLMLSGIALLAILTSSIATYFLSARKTGNPVIEEIKNKLDRIDDMSEVEIEVLQASFDAILKTRMGKKTVKAN
jgi:voltage-gated potassium channel